MIRFFNRKPVSTSFFLLFILLGREYSLLTKHQAGSIYTNLLNIASCFKILQDTLPQSLPIPLPLQLPLPLPLSVPAASVAHCLGGSSRRNIELSQLVPLAMETLAMAWGEGAWKRVLSTLLCAAYLFIHAVNRGEHISGSWQHLYCGSWLRLL